MSYSYKHYLWHRKCLQIINKEQKEKKKRILAFLIKLLTIEDEKCKRKYSRKRFWVDPLLERRKQHSFYYSLFPTVSLNDSMFFNYFCMTPAHFEELLTMIGPVISKQYLCREPISKAERLSLTLRFVFLYDKCLRSITVY